MLKLGKEQIAKIFEEYASLLELQDANPFRIRAYLRAARSLLNLDGSLETAIKEQRLTELPGIGSDLAEKITTLAKTGTHPAYESLKGSIPEGLSELMNIPSIGGKKIKVLHEVLKINSIEELKEACRKGKVAELPRFGLKTQAKILKGIEHMERYGRRHLWWDSLEAAQPILDGLQALKEVDQVELAGSARRKLETVGDLDFIAASSKPKVVMKWFVSWPSAEAVISHGLTKSSIRLEDGMQAELRIVPEKQYAFALCHTTGSKDHNIKLRQIANKKGFSLSEWGMVPKKGKTKSAKPPKKNMFSEADIYKELGLAFIPPELRENVGEIEAAAKGQMPCLIELQDIKGAFHVHTVASDGRNTLLDMVRAAEKRGWKYVGISDHSKSSFQANGLSEDRLIDQVKKIRSLNKSGEFKIHIFAGVECDILPNGEMDYANEILKELDFVIASVHSSLGQDEKKMTKRIIQAIENPYTTMIGHLTGRLLLRREASAVNVQKVIDACIANDKIMELNAHPQRLDMDWRYWHNASEKGLLCSINPDAHDISGLSHVLAGVNIARKGWLEKKHVINTYPLAKLKKLLQKR